MGENTFSVDLASMDSVLNNKTLRYRVNGFAYACGMKDIGATKLVAIDTYWLNSLGPSKEVDVNNAAIFSTLGNKRTCEGPNYFISINKNEHGLFGKNIIISGYYNDLSFAFTNYYDNKNIDKKVVELPFSISLAILIDEDNYTLNIETVRGVETKFTISKYREFKKRTTSRMQTFYANVLDFSNVLKLVKSFVYNPQLLFNTYNSIIESKKTVITNGDLNKGIMDDERLDKPVGKIKKKIKAIIG